MSETSGHWQAMEDSERCEFKYRRGFLVREYQMQKVTVNVIRKARFRFALRIIVFSKSRGRRITLLCTHMYTIYM